MRAHRYPSLLGDTRAQGLRRALTASVVLHALLFVAFGRFQLRPVDRTFFAPLHMVDLVEPGPAGPGRERAGPKPTPPPPAEKPATAAKAKPAAAPKPKAEPKPAPAAKPEPPAKPETKAAPVAMPEPKPTPEAKAKPRPEAPVVPSSEEPQRYTEERVAERIARLREKLGAPQDTAPSTAPPRTSMGDSKVRQAVESLRERLEPGARTAGGGQGATGAVGVRAGGNVLEEVRLRSYYNRLWDHVNSHWAIPPSLEGKGYTVIVSVVLDRGGQIRKATVEEPSASVAFDQSALRALERAAPLPPFPDQIKEDVLEVGFRFHGE